MFVLALEVDPSLNAAVVLAFGLVQDEADPGSGRKVGVAEVSHRAGHVSVSNQHPGPDREGNRLFGHLRCEVRLTIYTLMLVIQ